jgi:hypothetical protein
MIIHSTFSSIVPISELIILPQQSHKDQRSSISIDFPQYILTGACLISFDLFLTGFYSDIIISDAVQLFANFITIPPISAVSPTVHRDSIGLSPSSKSRERFNFDDAFPLSSLISDLSSIVILDEIRIITNLISFDINSLNDVQISGDTDLTPSKSTERNVPSLSSSPVMISPKHRSHHYHYDFEPLFTPIVNSLILTVFMDIPNIFDLSRLMFIDERSNDPLMSSVFSISYEDITSPVMSRSQPGSPLSPRSPVIPPSPLASVSPRPLASHGPSRITSSPTPPVPGNYHDLDLGSIPKLMRPVLDPIFLAWCIMSTSSSVNAVSGLVQPSVQGHDPEPSSVVFPPYDLPGHCLSSFESCLLTFYASVIPCHIVQLCAQL